MISGRRRTDLPHALAVSVLVCIAAGCGGNSKAGLSSHPDGGSAAPEDDATPGSRAPVEASAVGLDDDAGAQGGDGAGGAGAGGTGSAGQGLVIAPSSYSFGTIQPGQRSEPVTFTMANLGTVPSGVPTVIIDGADKDAFTIAANGCITPLPVSATCTIAVFYRPAAAGPASATLTATASPGGSIASSLTGVGGEPPPPPDAGVVLPPDAGVMPVPIAAFTPGEISIPYEGNGTPFIRFRLINAGTVRFWARPSVSQDPFPAGTPAQGIKLMYMSADPDQCRDNERILLPGDSCNVDIYYTGGGGGYQQARTIRVWALGDAGPLASAALKIGASPP